MRIKIDKLIMNRRIADNYFETSITSEESNDITLFHYIMYLNCEVLFDFSRFLDCLLSLSNAQMIRLSLSYALCFWDYWHSFNNDEIILDVMTP